MTAQALTFSSPQTALKNIITVVGASLLLSLCGPLAILLPFTPIPLVLTAQLVLLLSALLGSKRAFAAVSLYLFQGAIGLPVFAGGASGLAYMFGPTGGYLLGYLIAAFVVGALAPKAKNSTRLFGILCLGNCLIFLAGALHLSLFVQNAWMAGVIPFIPGDLIKLLLVCAALKKSRMLKEHAA